MADRYRIVLKGQLDTDWNTWFENLDIQYNDSGNTILSGPVSDSAALHGILDRIRDLNLELISVNRIGIDSDQSITRSD